MISWLRAHIRVDASAWKMPIHRIAWHVQWRCFYLPPEDVDPRQERGAIEAREDIALARGLSPETQSAGDSGCIW